MSQISEWTSIQNEPTDEKICVDNGGDFSSHANFAIATIVPVILALLCTSFHWFRLEKNWKRRFYTMPFLIFQMYPQFKMAEILYLGLWVKDKKWKIKQEALDSVV